MSISKTSMGVDHFSVRLSNDISKLPTRFSPMVQVNAYPFRIMMASNSRLGSGKDFLRNRASVHR